MTTLYDLVVSLEFQELHLRVPWLYFAIGLQKKLEQRLGATILGVMVSAALYWGIYTAIKHDSASRNKGLEPPILEVPITIPHMLKSSV